MSTWLPLILAVLLDIAIGDPPVRWHPVRLIGRYAARIESEMRAFGNGRWPGVAAFSIVVVSWAVLAAVLMLGAGLLHRYVATGVSAFLIFIAIAPRDLAQHATRVRRALDSGDLEGARYWVSRIVGRDTQALDMHDISRAAVESVAESTVDAVVAPLFWACLLGPVGAIICRVTNTLDSMWGHWEPPYRDFGWAAARADDWVAWLPSRLCVLWIAAAASLLGMNGRSALAFALRDGPKHASPNAGLGEAAYAGALGIGLGGGNHYDGVWIEGPSLGPPDVRPNAMSIRLAVRLMWATTFISLCVMGLARAATELF